MGDLALSDYFLPTRWSAPPPVPGENPYASQGAWQPATAPGQLMPAAHNSELMLLMVERFLRADAALEPWAVDGKRCIEFVEGKQWSVDELRMAEEEDRPTITLNKIAPLVRLVLGYHRNNRVDNRYLPTNDTASDQSVADALTKVAKQISQSTDEPYVDTEVFLDGITTGRGYYDWRLNFENNDFGDIKARAKDPFTIRPDPDADSYDPDDWNYVFEGRWVNLDEIEYTYGRNVSNIIAPLVRSSGYRGGIPADMIDYITEQTPWRTFGGQQADSWGQGSLSIESYIANSVDPYRKNIRLIECQHRIRVMQRNIVDLDTGDRTPIPDNFQQPQIQKIMQWAVEQYAMRGQACPLRVEWRPTKRVRWTTMVGDIIIYDNWSQYRSFTQVPYFPYFRRGQTRGMVDDLIDPQRELNKRRSAELDIVTRTAFSGWMWHKNSLDEAEKEKIENFGGAPGLNVEWQGNPDMKPEQIRPPMAPTAMDKLEQKATGDLKEIAGINDSALGQVDRVQSGRAIEARQRQSVLGIEMYMDNMRRTKRMVGRKKLEMIQTHYTEPRLVRIEGQGGTWDTIGINQPQLNGEILNNVTVGRYDVQIDETSLSATFMNAQFEELVDLIEKGVLPIPMVQDVLIDLSNAPQKVLLKQRLEAYLKAQGLITPDELTAIISGGGMPPPGSLPPPQPHGVPGKTPPQGRHAVEQGHAHPGGPTGQPGPGRPEAQPGSPPASAAASSQPAGPL